MKVTKKKGEIPYLERDISWMYFNRRILSEAEKAPVPLLERLSFLGIYSNNLDEFYRVRVATLNRIIEYEDKTIKAERETAIQTFREISRLNERPPVRHRDRNDRAEPRKSSGDPGGIFWNAGGTHRRRL